MKTYYLKAVLAGAVAALAALTVAYGDDSLTRAEMLSAAWSGLVAVGAALGINKEDVVEKVEALVNDVVEED